MLIVKGPSINAGALNMVGEEASTPDPLVPNQMRYQTALFTGTLRMLLVLS